MLLILATLLYAAIFGRLCRSKCLSRIQLGFSCNATVPTFNFSLVNIKYGGLQSKPRIREVRMTIVRGHPDASREMAQLILQK